MMKHTLLYIAAAITGAAAFTACDNDFEVPPVSGKPFETVEANTNLADVKTEYWSALSASTTIGYDANGDTIIFKGRVCSSDQSGNIFKNIVIQSVDENGQQVAFTFAVNAYDIYEHFAYGQEVAVKATGLEVGNYRSLLQIGSISGSDMTFMDESKFLEHVVATEPFAYKDRVVITPTTIAELESAKADPQKLMMWQSRLVKVENVSFVDAGEPCALGQNISRYIVGEDGSRLAVRMSSHADFKENLLPYGTGSVTGIITTFDNSWQLTLIDFDGIEGFDNQGGGDEPGTTVEPSGEGTIESPYNVVKALEIIASGNLPEGKVYVAGKISSIQEIDTGNYGNATYYIKDDKGNKELYIYRGLALGGDKFTSTDQLAVGADVVIYGELMNFKGNSPQMGQGNYIYSYNGQTAGGNTGGETGEAKGDGTLENPYNVAKTLQLIAEGNITEDNVYVTGVISRVKEVSLEYGNASYYIKDENGSQEFYIFRGYNLGNEKFTAENEIAAGATVVVYGKLINYMGNTPEMAQYNYIVSYNGQTSGTTPDPNPNPDHDANPGTPEGAIAASALAVPGTVTVDGYTITIAQGAGASAPVYNAGTSAARLYAGNTISIAGSGLKSITFNLSSDAHFRYTTVECSTGSISPAQAKGDTSFTWIGDASEVSFTVGEQATLGDDGDSKKGQIRFTSLNIN
ncbi:MAG: hypothetical protein K2K22_06255 [Muribaculaceae bacterium]|nr:hypothetical protein [Muribaculaceae bacterium]